MIRHSTGNAANLIFFRTYLFKYKAKYTAKTRGVLYKTPSISFATEAESKQSEITQKFLKSRVSKIDHTFLCDGLRFYGLQGEFSASNGDT